MTEDGGEVTPTYRLMALLARCRVLEGENAALRADKERLDYLETLKGKNVGFHPAYEAIDLGITVREAIDARETGGGIFVKKSDAKLYAEERDAYIARLETENDRLLADSERLDWLATGVVQVFACGVKDHVLELWSVEGIRNGRVFSCDGPTPRAAIDAARADQTHCSHVEAIRARRNPRHHSFSHAARDDRVLDPAIQSEPPARRLARPVDI